MKLRILIDCADCEKYAVLDGMYAPPPNDPTTVRELVERAAGQFEKKGWWFKDGEWHCPDEAQP